MTTSGKKEEPFLKIGRSKLDRRLNLVTSRFRKSVRPVYRSLDGTKPELIGSCVLLTVGADTFAVSAAHVTDYSPEFALFIAGTKGAEPVQMIGEILSTSVPDRGRDFDPYDTSFWPLSSDDLDKLGSVEPIRQREISLHLRDTGDRLFTAYGYPMIKNKKSVDNRNRNIVITAFPYSSRVVDRPGLARKLGITGEKHFFLDYKKRAATSDGVKVAAPDPHGMSGGALIDSGTFKSLFQSRYSEDNCGRLAGILLERHKPQSAILAIKVDFVLGLIRQWQSR